MRLPDNHFQALDQDLAGQEGRLNTLRRHIAGLQAEARAHETLLALGRDPGLRQALGALSHQSETLQHAIKEPLAYFHDHGITALDQVTLRVHREGFEASGPSGVVVEATVNNEGLRFRVGWSSRTGFYAATGAGALDDAPAAAAASAGAITIRIYEKRGLCRGPGIFDAAFWGVMNYPGRHRLSTTGPSPLSGTDPVYIVEHPAYIPNVTEWWVDITAPRHTPWTVPNVRDGETHEVWLEPA